MKLIIQIPCLNEADTLEITLNDLPKHIDGIDVIEYLIINDGSKDNTVKVALDWGVHHVVNFRNNKGLARGFMAGVDMCLRNGADIIVNTDADNQYFGEDIKKLVRPILDGRAGMVIGERPIMDTEHFSPAKKILQKFGSWVVRKASGTDIADAPSGFRAYSRNTAMRLNVINEYTYTLETIVQAGVKKMAVMSVPIRTNSELRPSRLFNSMFNYIKKSMITIMRATIMYRPLRFFIGIGVLFGLSGLVIFIRYLLFWSQGQGQGNVQSLLFGSTAIIISFVSFIMGFIGDILASNRKILEETQYEIRRMRYGKSHEEQKKETISACVELD